MDIVNKQPLYTGAVEILFDLHVELMCENIKRSKITPTPATLTQM